MPPGGEVSTPGTATGTGTGTGTSTGTGMGAHDGQRRGQEHAGRRCARTRIKLCAETFTYPYNGEQSVELRGDYRAGAWTMGDMMTHTGSAWASCPSAYPGASPSSTSSSSTG